MESEVLMRIGMASVRPELETLDRFHMKRGDYADWMVSEERTYFAGNQKVRIVTWSNLLELCSKTDLPEAVVIAAYEEALDTGDTLFVTYEEIDG